KVMTDDGEIVGILERDGVEIRNGELRGLGDEFAKAERALGMTVNDVAVLGFASVGSYLPFLRRGGDQHFARGGAGLAESQPGILYAAAAAGTKVIDFWIGGRLLDVHLLPIDTKLFGEDHGAGRINALALFCFLE